MQLVKQGYTSDNLSVCIYFDLTQKIYIVKASNMLGQTMYQRTFGNLVEAEKKFITLTK